MKQLQDCCITARRITRQRRPMKPNQSVTNSTIHPVLKPKAQYP